MNVLIVTAGGGDSGLGHIARSKHLANVLRDKHRANARFVVEVKGEGATRLLPDWTVVYETDNLPAYLAAGWRDLRQSADVIVVDLEHGVPEWMDVYLHDLPAVSICGTAYRSDNPSAVDLVIVQDNSVDDPPPGWEWGYKWSILDPRFASVGPAGDGIFVSGGGTDFANVTVKLLRALNHLGGRLSVEVIVGPGFMNQAALDEQIDYMRHAVTLHYTPKDIPRIMSRCQLAVVSYGMTALECLAAGLPTITVGVTGRHVGAALGLGDAAVQLGHVAETDDGVISATVANLLRDPDWRLRLADRGRALIDGRGVYRVAERVIGLATGGENA